MTRRLRGLAAVATLGLAGCYSYLPMERPPQAGARIRARLSAPEAIRISERTGEARRELEGILVAAEAETISLHVVFARVQAGAGRSFANQDTLAIQLSEVLELHERRLSWFRTGALGAIVGGLVAFGASEAFGGVSGKGHAEGEGRGR
ncbi:MAG: hypothetical protein OXR82_02355 [Gammaproteobacteria bacterium]|nr:hypothetical protein [Gammaproteobacteria bacterium]MDE0257217.1 hypothetical protein [Gammaproteobacteria bacterium]